MLCRYFLCRNNNRTEKRKHKKHGPILQLVYFTIHLCFDVYGREDQGQHIKGKSRQDALICPEISGQGEEVMQRNEKGVWECAMQISLQEAKVGQQNALRDASTLQRRENAKTTCQTGLTELCGQLFHFSWLVNCKKPIFKNSFLKAPLLPFVGI